METITLNLYKFDELSAEAQQKVIKKFLNSDRDYFWGDDNKKTLEKFAEVFPIKIRDWSYGGRGEGVYFEFTCDDNIEELKGQRLATYIWNNYRSELFKGKYYGDANVKHCIKHKRIKTKDYKNGNFGNAYYSAITLDNSCPLTGYCMDDSILEPIYSFLDKPTDINFKELLDKCFDAWVESCNNDVDYQNTEEFAREEIENKNDNYTENGIEY